MQRKIFIGIDLPAEVKKRLMQKIEKWQDLPIRWSAEENLHITLSFLGYVDDELLPGICDGVRMAVEDFDMFDISFSEIELGPELGKEAKLVWFTGEASSELKDLEEKIQKELGFFQSEKKTFRPHVTLGRVRKIKWQAQKNIPKISEKFSVFVPVENVSVIESTVIDGERKFITIEACPLNY